MELSLVSAIPRTPSQGPFPCFIVAPSLIALLTPSVGTLLAHK